MDAESLLAALVLFQLAASAAVLVVLLLRPLALRWCGAGTAYWLWLVVPLAAMAVLLPAREQVVVIPALQNIPILQQLVEPDLDLGVTQELAAQPSIPDDRLRSGLSRSGVLIAFWLLGAGAFLIRSIIITRRLASGASVGPALVGVLRPRLVLPHDFEARFSAEERVLILAHEEMHRVSLHMLVNALVEVARCASWFNPLLHWAATRFRSDQELACDTAVIAAYPEARRTYAEALLKAQVAGVYLPMGCTWTSGNAGRLAERIARLSQQLPGRRRRFVGATSIVGIGIAASYAAWAQQPPRIITVQQPNTENAAVVASETPALEAPEAARAPAADVPDNSRPSASKPPVRTPATQAPQGTLSAAVETETPAINGDAGSATYGSPAAMAFAMDAVIDDRRTRQVNGVTVSNLPTDVGPDGKHGTFGTPVCRVTRDGAPALDIHRRPPPGADSLAKLAENCQPLNSGCAAARLWCTDSLTQFTKDEQRRMDVVTDGASATFGSGAMRQDAAERQKELLKDPEYRKRVLAQMRIVVKQINQRFTRELDLSEKEAESLFDLLADNQVTNMVEGTFSVGQIETQEALQARRAIVRMQEESIQALLGDKYAQWQDYQQSRSGPSQVTYASAQVNYVSTQLAQAGKPLTAGQNRALTTALITEQQRQAQERRALPANPADQEKTMEENYRRTLDSIALHVNAEQLAALLAALGERTKGLPFSVGQAF